MCSFNYERSIQRFPSSCALLAFFALAPASHAAVASLDDIAFWVGAGANRAGLAIDWDGGSAADESLAWGFRWDGAASGADMIRATIAADPRLFAKLDPGGILGLAVYGIGYDRNADGQFVIDDGTVFDDDGVAVSGPADLAESSDPGDSYREGWFAGVWNYATADVNPWAGNAWSHSVIGASRRVLVDGAWDSWAFTPTFLTTAYAINAAPAAVASSADFDGDGRVDGTDFLAWQRGLDPAGGASRAQGDANGDGVVDAADLAAWKAQFGVGAMASAVAVAPEPFAATTCASAMFVVFLFFHHRRRQDS